MTLYGVYMSLFYGLLLLRLLILLRIRSRCLAAYYALLLHGVGGLRRTFLQRVLLSRRYLLLFTYQGFMSALRRGRGGAFGSSERSGHQYVLSYGLAGRLIMTSTTACESTRLVREGLGGDSYVVERSACRYQVGRRARVYFLHAFCTYSSRFGEIYHVFQGRSLGFLLAYTRAFCVSYGLLRRLGVFLGEFLYVSVFLRLYYGAVGAGLIRLVRYGGCAIVVLFFGSTMDYRYFRRATIVSASYGIVRVRFSGRKYDDGSRLSLYGIE